MRLSPDLASGPGRSSGPCPAPPAPLPLRVLIRFFIAASRQYDGIFVPFARDSFIRSPFPRRKPS
jgi:hypothetical protein